ncbi:MAG: transposase [Phycisphaerae bacterium]|nr:transposase [Phycisphaerae bacterium]
MAKRGGSPKPSQWRKRIGQYRRSGLTVAEFCGEEGISTASFYAWRRRLQDGKTAGKDERPVFEPVRLTTAGRPMTVHLPGGVRVEVPTENLDAVRVVMGEVLGRAAVPVGADASC